VFPVSHTHRVDEDEDDLEEEHITKVRYVFVCKDLHPAFSTSDRNESFQLCLSLMLVKSFQLMGPVSPRPGAWSFVVCLSGGGRPLS
jgi:hypothetical protein